MHLDRRRGERDRRLTGRIAAVFAVRNIAGSEVQLGQAEDIGPAGMTLRWPKDAALTPSASLTLTFELPGTRAAIAARGQVVSERRAGRYRRTGVRFIEVEPEAAELIAEYCAARP